jgi:hypothetical protein
VLETLHYGLASRRMITWSRSLSRRRKALGLLDIEDQSEDLVDVETMTMVWSGRS